MTNRTTQDATLQAGDPVIEAISNLGDYINKLKAERDSARNALVNLLLLVESDYTLTSADKQEITHPYVIAARAAIVEVTA